MAGRATQLAGLTPSELVTKIRSGDEAARSELYVRYAGRLLGILRRETRDEDLAQDLCQETFARALERFKASGPAEPDKVGAFLFGIAKNLLREGWRRQERQRTDVDSERIESIADEQSNPYLSVSQQQLVAAVRESINQLSVGRDRELAYRLFLDEADPATVCRELEVSREHLSRLRYRVLKRLKEVLTVEAREAAESAGLGERNPG